MELDKIKQYSIIGVVAVGIVIIVVSRFGGSKSGDTQIVTTGPSDAELAAANANSQRNFQLAAAAQQAQLQIALQDRVNITEARKLQMQMNIAQIGANSAAMQATTNAQSQLNLAKISAENLKEQLASTIQLGEIDARKMIVQNTIIADAQLQQQKVATNTQLALAKTAADTALQQSKFAADLTLQAGRNQVEIALAEKTARLQAVGMQVELAKLISTNASNVAINRDNKQADTAQNSSDNGLWGSVINLVGSIF